MLAFEKYDAEHQKLWDTMKIVRDAAELERVEKKIRQYQSVYEAVEKDTGVPWQLVAVIHLREAGEQDIGKFQKGIHNGQSWRIKATIIPKIGPFKSWHECAVVALTREGLTKIGKGNWTPAKMLSAAEPYNGYGPRMRGRRSGYLWASTNHQQPGKFIHDGPSGWRPDVMDTQVGVAAQLKFLGVGAKPTSVPTVIKQEGTTVGFFGTLAYIFQEQIIPIAIAGGLVLAMIWVYRAMSRE